MTLHGPSDINHSRQELHTTSISSSLRVAHRHRLTPLARRTMLLYHFENPGNHVDKLNILYYAAAVASICHNYYDYEAHRIQLIFSTSRFVLAVNLNRNQNRRSYTRIIQYMPYGHHMACVYPDILLQLHTLHWTMNDAQRFVNLYHACGMLQYNILYR